MESKLTILGCGSAAPSLQRANTAQILEMAGQVILIDCGEGTQWQMLKRKISAYKIDIIFISHLHGDHYLGLPGLLNTLSLYGRERPLKIFGPKGIKSLLFHNFKEAEIFPCYEVSVNEINTKKHKKIYQENELSVTAIPLQHRIPCYGFHFQLNHFSLKINKQKCDAALLEVDAIKVFKKGLDYTKNNKTYFYKDFTSPYHVQQSYTFITDTLFLPQLAPIFKDTDILYHESTYLNNLLDKAKTTYHCTALQAAEMANHCKARVLVLGHFSSRYAQTDELLAEARSLFANTELADDGRIFIIK
ncbi:MAG: ribonuclease Z [Bacteroidia bacterium]